MRRIIISDLHLGSMFSKEDDIIKLLKTENYDQLILGGDIIDFIRIPTFTKKSFEIFNIISNLTIPIIYIIGNHDLAFNSFNELSSNNITFLKKFDFIDNNKKIRIEHGDDYDNFIIKWEFIMNFICIITNIFERIFFIDLSYYWEKHKNKIFINKVNINNIIKKNNDVDIFIMGHTHKPEIIENDKFIYANSGDWVQNKSYIIIENGNIELKYL